MTAILQHERERRRRRAGRGSGLLAVAVALLAQATLPHVHLAQTTDGAVPPSSRSVALESDTAATTLAADARSATSEHAESRCPVCQILAHAHDLLPATAPVRAHIDDERHASAPTLPAGPSHERPTAHAPRSPPFPA